ncbi:MAG: hypothetical protein EZS28_042195 [Streblomastix strix]|uniref:Uncharacterized protein n=1 Tax=Streblomastix strix TaxID=222440 RepID=A0A5J4TVV2_9EUKA|nr:MAG: hypothetical protein EZS28_042195 [Streblomastix strix]
MGDRFQDGTNLWTPLKKCCHIAIHAKNQLKLVLRNFFNFLSETKVATEEFSKDKSNQQTIVKCETFEKGPKRKYTRKSKTDEKAKAMINQMINEQTNEQTNEPTDRQIIEEKYDERIHELRNQHGGTDKEQDERNYLIYRLEKNRENNIFEEVMQRLEELYMQEKDSKTIIERVKEAMINTVNYTKIGQQEGKKQQITGKLIDLSLMDEDNLCVVDIDIHKDKSIEEIDKIRKNLIDSLPPNVSLVKTAHGGLHIQVVNEKEPCPHIDKHDDLPTSEITSDITNS